MGPCPDVDGPQKFLRSCVGENASSMIGFPNSSHFQHRTPLILDTYCSAVDFEDSARKIAERARGASLGCVFVGPVSELTVGSSPKSTRIRQCDPTDAPRSYSPPPNLVKTRQMNTVDGGTEPLLPPSVDLPFRHQVIRLASHRPHSSLLFQR